MSDKGRIKYLEKVIDRHIVHQKKKDKRIAELEAQNSRLADNCDKLCDVQGELKAELAEASEWASKYVALNADYLRKKAELADTEKMFVSVRNERWDLKRENKRLREALEWYAENGEHPRCAIDTLTDKTTEGVTR